MRFRVLIAAISLAGAALLGGVGSVADPPPTSVFVDGKQVDYPAREVDGSLYVPVSLLSGPLGHPVKQVGRELFVVTSPSTEHQSVLVISADTTAAEAASAAGIAVMQSSALPPKLDKQFSCVVLLSGAAVRAETPEQLKQFVAEGGGVVTAGQVPLILGGGRNLDSIKEWFGAGGAETSNGTDIALRLVSPESVGFNSTGATFYRAVNEDTVSFRFLEPKTARLVQSTAPSADPYGFTHSYGEGRVVCLPVTKAKPGYTDPPGLLLAAIKWAARMR